MDNTVNTLQITIAGLPKEDSIREIVITGMLELDFDSFWEEGSLLHGYIAENLYLPEHLKLMLDEVLHGRPLEIAAYILENKNWNEEWEKNFPPADIDGQIYVSAPFHPERPEIPYQIRIVPKMSFGTAHHATTSSMLKLMLDMDFSHQTVIDAGTGTGILAIFAEMRGATEILAYDNDDWSVENAIENTERNGCKCITIRKGEKEILEGATCDTLLANIHKNVILGDIPSYAKTLKTGGNLLLSGFYADDLPDISEACEKHGLEIDKFLIKENWVAARFIKEK